MDAKETVAVSFIHPPGPRSVSGRFAASLAATMSQVRQIGGMLVKASGPRIAAARNAVVREFLTTRHDWLLMVDSDMYWRPEAAARLLAGAHSHKRPVIGGLCFAHQQGILYPTIYRYAEDGRSLLTTVDFPRDTIVRVDATGAAFLLVHRRPLEKLAQLRPGPQPWFAEELTEDGRERGEDLVFCDRLRRAGYEIHVDTGVAVGHEKDWSVDLAAFEAQQAVPPALVTGGPGLDEEWVARALNGLGIATGLREVYRPGEEPRRSPFLAEVNWPASVVAASHPGRVAAVLCDPPDGPPGDPVWAELADAMGIGEDQVEEGHASLQAAAVAAADDTVTWDELTDPGGEGLLRLAAACGYPRDLGSCRAVVAALAGEGA